METIIKYLYMIIAGRFYFQKFLQLLLEPLKTFSSYNS